MAPDPAVDLRRTPVTRDLDGPVHQREPHAAVHQAAKGLQPIPDEDRVAGPAVRIDRDGIGTLEHLVVGNPAAGVDLDLEVRHRLEAALEQQRAGPMLVGAGSMGRRACDQHEPAHRDVPPRSPWNNGRRNASPSTARASWVAASGRQMDAARAIAALWAVNDSMQIGPV